MAVLRSLLFYLVFYAASVFFVLGSVVAMVVAVIMAGAVLLVPLPLHPLVQLPAPIIHGILIPVMATGFLLRKIPTARINIKICPVNGGALVVLATLARVIPEVPVLLHRLQHLNVTPPLLLIFHA